MNKPDFIRWSGIAIIIAAVSNLASDFMQNTPIFIYGVILIGTLIGFIGIHQYQKDSARALSLISVVVLFLTGFFYASGSDNLGDITFPLSFLLLGIASYQADKFPRWVSSALILGVVINLIGPSLSSFPRTVEQIGGLSADIAFLVMGYLLWKETS